MIKFACKHINTQKLQPTKARTAGSSIAVSASRLALAKSIIYVTTLAASMFLSRLLTLTEYGTYVQIQVTATLILSVFSMGLPECSSFFLSRNEDPVFRRGFLSTYYTVNTWQGFAAGVMAAAFSFVIVEYYHNPALAGFVYVLAVFPWINIMINSLDNILVVYERTTSLMVFRIITSCLQLMVLAVTYLFRLSFEQYMVLFVAVQAVCALSVYGIVSHIAGRLRVHIDFELLKSIVRFSVPLGLASIVSTINIQLDKLIISNYFSTEQLAVYNNAAQELPITIISSALTAVLIPQIVKLLSKKRFNDVIKLWGHAIALVYMLFCFFVSLLIVFAPQAITLLYSSKYVGGAAVFRVYCLVALLRVTYFGMILNCIGKTRFILYSSIASLAINVGLNYLCYSIWGFEGPAIATFLCILIINLIQLVFTSHCIEIPFRGIFPWKLLLKITLLNIAFAVVFYLLGACFHVSAPVAACAWVVLYALAALPQTRIQWRGLSASCEETAS